MGNNQWLSVSDLIEILKTMPQDAKVVVDNRSEYMDGLYYATRDSIEHYAPYVSADENGVYEEDQVIIGTNYNTRALED